MTKKQVPVLCTLDHGAAGQRVLEWADIRDQIIAIEAITSGTRVRLPVALEASISDLIVREQQCCAFLTFASTTTEDEVIVEITSENSDALPVIHMLTGGEQ